MVNPKVMIVAIVAGFILSFLTGLLAGVSIAVVLLRALGFSVLFGVLAFVSTVVFRKFLVSDSDLVESAAEPTSVAQTGTLVDISVGDEPLPDENNGLDFYVNDSDASPSVGGKPVERKSDDEVPPAVSDTKKPEEVTAISEQEQIAVVSNKGSDNDQRIESAADGFRPVTLGTPLDAGLSNVLNESLDVLPDITDLSTGIDSGGGSSTVLENTDFAMEGLSETVRTSRGGSGGMMDTETIAKAIKTVLSKDS